MVPISTRLFLHPLHSLTTRREWFTLCFVPLIPFSFKPWHEVSCHVCQFHQDIKYRPDVQQQLNGGPAAAAIPMTNQGHQAGQGQPPQPYVQNQGPPAYK